MPNYMGSKNTSPELRGAIVQMAKQGFHTAMIADTFHMPKRTIQHIVRIYSIWGDFIDALKSGRPRLVDERTIHGHWRGIDAKHFKILQISHPLQLAHQLENGPFPGLSITL